MDGWRDRFILKDLDLVALECEIVFESLRDYPPFQELMRPKA